MPNERPETAPSQGAEDPCRVAVQRDGPFLVDGPVEVTLEDGSTVRSDRFRVALCTCRRSRRYPWCDASHRRRVRE
ncbi:CDGSH iron-sulfur domain-containing protein [Streptomyces indicus]|uniref:Iron-binding zinc finger CDGSH type n=1 Tax=Streptomyces indicus TaxID=417292 RepID=A0A1G8UVH9_9ACTN|nr:CDGSH iron-sulfur domain-containing protein [Streptomyces indicus]SDJ57798.1 Iron-binding zinc finger CDGSH type [Streptomyces indicus]